MATVGSQHACLLVGKQRWRPLDEKFAGFDLTLAFLCIASPSDNSNEL